MCPKADTTNGTHTYTQQLSVSCHIGIFLQNDFKANYIHQYFMKL